MRMTRKRKQEAKKVVRGAIEYGHKNISEHAAQAFACVNADEDECTDNTHTDTKIPYGKNNQRKTMREFCTWARPDTRPNESKRCLPKSWSTLPNMQYKQNLEDWYVDMVEPGYDEWAENNQPGNPIQLRREMGSSYFRDQRRQSSN